MSAESRRNNNQTPEQAKNKLVGFVENDVVVKRLAFTGAFLGLLEMPALSNSLSSENLIKVLAFIIFSTVVAAGYQVLDNIEKSKPNI